VSVVANVAINIDGKQAESLLKSIQSEVEKLNGTFDQIPKKTGNIFGKLKGAIVPVVGQLATLAGAAVTVRQAFDTLAQQSQAEAALRTLGVNSDVATESFKRLSAELQGQASVVELTAAAYDVASAGFTNTADQTRILEAATKGAVGGMSDINTVGNAVTSVLNAYGLSADEAGNLVDGFIQTQNDGKVVLGEYAGLIGRLAPTAAAAGVGIKELNAAIATITAQGVAPESAITGLNQAIVSILKPTSQASGLASELGIEFNETALRTKGLSGFLDEVAKATGGSASQLTTLFGSIDALKSVLPLLSGDMEKFVENLIKQDNAAGVATKAFDEMANTLDGALKGVDTAFKNLVVSFEPLIPAILVPLQLLAGTLNLVAENIKGIAIAAAFFGTFALTMKSLLIAFKAYQAIVVATAAAKKALGIAAAFFQAVMNPAALAQIGIALGVATAAAVTLGNAMGESGLKAEEAKLKQSGVAGATAAVKDEAAKLTEETNKQAAALDQLPPKIEDAKEKTKQLKEAQDAVTKAISESSQAIDKTAAMNQAVADQRSSVTKAYLKAEMQINDVLLEQLNRQLDGAKTQKDRINIARDIYKLSVTQAKLEYEITKVQISAAVEKASLALQATELKAKEVQLAVELAAAEGTVNDSHYKSLQLAREAVNLATEQLSTTRLIAVQQERAARATLQGKINAADAAFQANILARNTSSAASAAERLAIGFQQAAVAASSMSDNEFTKKIYGSTTTTTTLPTGTPIPGSKVLPFAKGGVVTKPTLGLIGEGGESEYIVPESKAAAFAANYLSGARGSNAIPRFAEGGYVGPINVQTGPVMQQNGQQYVSMGDLENAMQTVVNTILGNGRTPGGRRYSGVG